MNPRTVPMLRKLMPRSVYDVMAAVGCFAALATGTAYAANTVFSSDIVDGEVKSVDIGNNEIGSADVKDNTINTFDVHSFLGVDVVDGTLTGADVQDGTLKDEDVGSATRTSVDVAIGVVPAHACVSRTVDVVGVVAAGSHLVLTPDSTDLTGGVVFQVGILGGGTNIPVEILACNITGGAIDEGSNTFNVLAIAP
jgi:hypothetical protein